MTTISPIRYEVEIHAPLSTPVPMPPSMSSSEALVIWMLRTAMNAPMRPAATDIQTRRLAPSLPGVSWPGAGMSFMTSLAAVGALLLFHRGARGMLVIRRGALGIHHRLDRHSGPQTAGGVVRRVEDDLNGNALHDFGEVAGGVVGRKQREFPGTGRRDAVDMAPDLRVREAV